MQVKTFIDESLPKALYKAKQEHGNDIILLESQEFKDPGKFGDKVMVKITVSIQDGNDKVKSWQPPQVKRYEEQTEPKKRAQSKEEKKFDEVIQGILAKKPKELDQEKKILDELASLRKEIANLSVKTEAAGEPDFPNVFNDMYRQLKEKGIADDIAKAWIRRIYHLYENPDKVSSRDIRKSIKTEMRRIVKPYTFSKNGVHNRPKVVLLLGATGVGKTTTAMKLAAHPDMYAQKDVAIISTDPYGPSEALKSFGKISGVQVAEARGTEEIAKTIEKFQDKDVVIVDTPGRSPFESNHLKILEEYVKVVKPSEIFLVLSMSTDLDDLFLSCAMYMLLKPTGVAFTKFDETTKPGKLFSILDELKLPVVYFSEGKRVFIDIAPGRVDYIENKIFDQN